ncbi:MAG: helix-turn-helix domain-containing protein [Ilumatobacteraceae bacterium]|nr:helix-turn-helix domain-containing protein [Ilumatobacteraceae bacterium]
MAVPPAQMSPDPRARLDLFKTLGDNTRYAIYLELARATKPLTTAEVADTIELHPNTVRPHLERMRDAGLVVVEVGGRGEIGRPQHRYSLAADAPSLGLEPPVMPVLARMVLSMAERLGASADDARAVGDSEGAVRAERFSAAPSSLEAIVSELDMLGFDPVVSDDADDPDAAVIAFANCPFGDLAVAHPDLVCSLHHGLIAGFVGQMGDTEVRSFCTVVDRTPCQVTVGDVSR